MVDLFVPPAQPTVNSTVATTANVLMASFGDGYEQTIAAGLNSVSGVYSVAWDSLSQADRQTIETFLANEGGYKSFAYTFPGESTQRKFKCKTWNRGHVGSLFSLTAEFREVFDLGLVTATFVSSSGTSISGATVTALATSRGAGMGASAGIGFVAGVGRDISPGTGVSTGVGTVTGVSAGTAGGDPVGLLLALTTPNTVPSTRGAGSAAGTSTVTGVGSNFVGSGASTGSSTVTAVGRSTSAATGASTGVTSVLAVGRDTAAATGASTGASAVAGVSPVTGTGESLGLLLGLTKP